MTAHWPVPAIGFYLVAFCLAMMLSLLSLVSRFTSAGLIWTPSRRHLCVISGWSYLKASNYYWRVVTAPRFLIPLILIGSIPGSNFTFAKGGGPPTLYGPFGDHAMRISCQGLGPNCGHQRDRNSEMHRYRGPTKCHRDGR
jgi:hypothetical protein